MKSFGQVLNEVRTASKVSPPPPQPIARPVYLSWAVYRSDGVLVASDLEYFDAKYRAERLTDQQRDPRVFYSARWTCPHCRAPSGIDALTGACTDCGAGGRE